MNLWRSDCPLYPRVAEVVPAIFDGANGNRQIPGAMLLIMKDGTAKPVGAKWIASTAALTGDDA